MCFYLGSIQCIFQYLLLRVKRNSLIRKVWRWWVSLTQGCGWTILLSTTKHHIWGFFPQEKKEIGLTIVIHRQLQGEWRCCPFCPTLSPSYSDHSQSAAQWRHNILCWKKNQMKTKTKPQTYRLRKQHWCPKAWLTLCQMPHTNIIEN